MIGAKNFIGSLIDQWLQKWSNCKILSWDSLKPQKETFQERIFKSTQRFLFWMILTLWPKSCPIVVIKGMSAPSVVWKNYSYAIRLCDQTTSNLFWLNSTVYQLPHSFEIETCATCAKLIFVNIFHLICDILKWINFKNAILVSLYL